jgi:hypothetical protein
LHRRHALGTEQLEGEPDPFGRILDSGEGIGYVRQQVLTPAPVATLPHRVGTGTAGWHVRESTCKARQEQTA